jgi:hypothetical protein
MTWIVPLGITILAAIGAASMTRRAPTYGPYAMHLTMVIVWLVAIIVSLAAWLVWAVVT